MPKLPNEIPRLWKRKDCPEEHQRVQVTHVRGDRISVLYTNLRTLETDQGTFTLAQLMTFAEPTPSSVPKGRKVLGPVVAKECKQQKCVSGAEEQEKLIE